MTVATSPVQTSPVSALGPDDGPPPLAQAHLPPPSLPQGSPYSHGPLAQSYPPMPMHASSPHLQHTNGISAYSVPQTPPTGSYEVGVGVQQQPQQNGAMTNGHAAVNGAAAAGLGRSPPESPASHSTPSTGPSAHVPLPPSSYPQYMGYPAYTSAGAAPRISTFYQRHHYPPEAYTGPTSAPTASAQPAITSADQRYQQPQSALHHPADHLVEKERRRGRPSISSISSGQSPSESPVITNGRLMHPSDRPTPSHHHDAAGHWESGYVPYSSGGGSAGPHATASVPSTNGDASYNIPASAGSYHAHAAQATPSTAAIHYAHPHYDVHSPPPLPPPPSTGSTTSTNSVASSLLSEASHASSHTSYMSHMGGGLSDHGHSGHGHPHSNGVRSPPPILAPIQSSLRGDPTGPGMAGLGMGMGGVGGYHVSALSARHHLQHRPYGQVGYAVAAESGYAGNGKGYDV